MPLAEDFAAAQVKIKQLTRSPSADELLELYALYKQAVAGDVSGKRPDMFDFKARAKYDAWSKKQGSSPDAAQAAYVALVETLTAKYR